MRATGLLDVFVVYKKDTNDELKRNKLFINNLCKYKEVKEFD